MSVGVRKKIFFFGHLSELSNTCRMRVIEVSNTDAYQTSQHD
jgi:hypothetical protein